MPSLENAGLDAARKTPAPQCEPVAALTVVDQGLLELVLLKPAERILDDEGASVPQ